MDHYALKLSDGDKTFRVATERVTRKESTGEGEVEKAYLPLVSEVNEGKIEAAINSEPSITSYSITIYDADRDLSAVFEKDNYQNFVGQLYFLDSKNEGPFKGYVTDVDESDNMISFSLRADIDYNADYLEKFETDTFQKFEMRTADEANVAPYVTNKREMDWLIADADKANRDYDFRKTKKECKYDSKGNLHSVFLEKNNNAVFYRLIQNSEEVSGNSDLSFSSDRENYSITEQIINIGDITQSYKIGGVLDLVIDPNDNPWVLIYNYSRRVAEVYSRTSGSNNTEWALENSYNLDLTRNFFGGDKKPLVGVFQSVPDKSFNLFTVGSDVYFSCIRSDRRKNSSNNEIGRVTLLFEKVTDSSVSNSFELNPHVSDKPAGYFVSNYDLISDGTNIYIGLQAAQLEGFSLEGTLNFVQYYLKVDVLNLSFQEIVTLNSRSYSLGIFQDPPGKRVPNISLDLFDNGNLAIISEAIDRWYPTPNFTTNVHLHVTDFSSSPPTFNTIGLFNSNIDFTDAISNGFWLDNYYSDFINDGKSLTKGSTAPVSSLNIVSNGNRLCHITIQLRMEFDSGLPQKSGYYTFYSMFRLNSTLDGILSDQEYVVPLCASAPPPFRVGEDFGNFVIPPFYFGLDVNSNNVFASVFGLGANEEKNILDLYENTYDKDRVCSEIPYFNSASITGSDDVDVDATNDEIINIGEDVSSVSFGERVIVYDSDGNVVINSTVQTAVDSNTIRVNEDLSTGSSPYSGGYEVYDIKLTESFDNSSSPKSVGGSIAGGSIGLIEGDDFSNFIGISNGNDIIAISQDNKVKAVAQRTGQVHNFNLIGNSGGEPKYELLSQQMYQEDSNGEPVRYVNGGNIAKEEAVQVDADEDLAFITVFIDDDNQGNTYDRIRYDVGTDRLLKEDFGSLFLGKHIAPVSENWIGLNPSYTIKEFLNEMASDLGGVSNFQNLINYAVVGDFGQQYYRLIGYLTKTLRPFQRITPNELKGNLEDSNKRGLNLNCPMVLNYQEIKPDVAANNLPTDWTLNDLSIRHWRVAEFQDFGIGDGNIVDQNYRIRPLRYYDSDSNISDQRIENFYDNRDKVYVQASGQILQDNDLGFVNFGQKYNIENSGFDIENPTDVNEFNKMHRIKFNRKIKTTSDAEVDIFDTNIGELDIHNDAIDIDIENSFHDEAIQEPWAGFSAPKYPFFENNFNYQSEEKEPNKIEFLNIGFIVKDLLLSVDRVSEDIDLDRDESIIQKEFKDRLKGNRIDLVKDDNIVVDDIGQNKLQSKLVNQASSKFGIVTSSGVESLETDNGSVYRILERLYFNVPDAFKVPLEAVKVVDKKEQVEKDLAEAKAKVRGEEGLGRENYTNNLIFDTDFSDNKTKIFSVDSAQNFFLTSSYRIIKDKVPGGTDFLGQFFPLAFGFLEKVPLMHVIGQHVDNEQQWTAGGDVYVYSFNETDVTNPGDIDVYLDQSKDITLQGEENIHRIESPFPKFDKQHYEEIVEHISGQATTTIKQKTLSNPYHKLINKEINDGKDKVMGLQLRGKEWNQELSSLDSRFPVRNGVGQTKLFASFGGAVDETGKYGGYQEIIKHPLDIIHYFLSNYGRFPFDGSVVDRDNIERLKSKTPKHVAGIFVDEQISPYRLISRICNQFGYFWTFYKGKLKFYRLDFKDVYWGKPISSNLNLLSDVENTAMGYEDIYTSVDYRYNRDYMRDEFAESIKYDDENNELCQRASRVRSQDQPLVIEAEYVNSDAVAREVSQRIVKFRCNRKINYDIRVRKPDYELIPGQFVPLTYEPEDIRDEPVLINNRTKSDNILSLSITRFPNVFTSDIDLQQKIEQTSQAVTDVDFAPISDAGSDALATQGQTYTLDGSGSYDPSGDSLTYSWQIVSKPSSGSATINNANSKYASITPDEDDESDWVFELTVDNGSMQDSDRKVLDMLFYYDYLKEQFSTTFAHWRLEDESGTTALELENNLDGSYQGTYTLAEEGLLADDNPIVEFDGSSGRVEVPDNAFFDVTSSDSFTICAWVKPNSGATQYNYIAAKLASSSGFQLWYDINNNVFATYLGDGTDTVSLSGGGSVSPDELHFVSLVIDRSTDQVKIYSNAGAVNTTKDISTIDAMSNNTDLYFGMRGDQVRFFDGNIGQVTYFKKALSESEMDALYNHGLNS